MIKLLVKKEFIALFSSFFLNRKTGKKRSNGNSRLSIVLYGLLLLFLFAVFFFLSYTLGVAFIPMGLDWFYFSFLGLIALLFGIFGDVFNTYKMLYDAKDNDLLFSLPIKGSQILLSRMIVVFLMGFMYMSLIWLPSIVGYWIIKGWLGAKTILYVIEELFVGFSLALIVTTLTCALGYLVAQISKKMKNKNILTAIISLLFFALYYFFCMRFSSIIEDLIQNVDIVSGVLKKFYPVYLYGSANSGNLLHTFIFILISFVLFGLCFYIISHSFMKLATKSEKTVKKKYSKNEIHVVSQNRALLNKEAKRVVSSTTYFLNCSLGVIIMPILAIVVIIYSSRLNSVLEMIKETAIYSFMPLLSASAATLIASLGLFSAPSISLEGKNIWILQSLPVDPMKVLRSKVNLGFIFNVSSAIILTTALSIVLTHSLLATILSLCFVILFCYLHSQIGLVMNLKHYSFTWTNEAIPIKQGFASILTITFGFIFSLLPFGGFYLVKRWINVYIYYGLFIAIMALLILLMNNWLKKKGTLIFRYAN